jgi:hypothetical protein
MQEKQLHFAVLKPEDSKMSRRFDKEAKAEIIKYGAGMSHMGNILTFIKKSIFEIECNVRNIDRKDIFISCPEYFHHMMDQYFINTFHHPFDFRDGKKKYEGVEFTPHYYNEIVIFNRKRYPDEEVKCFIMSLEFK